MEEWQVVILYGASLLLAGLEACLHSLPGLQVICVNDDLPIAVQRLQALKPDAILFDRNDERMRDLDAVVRLLQANSHTLVVGLNVNDDDLIILSHHQHAASHLDNLLAVIRTRSHPR